ncbi:MAG: YfbM family protein [Proteobacteria bacterium]|nr:YfbM family protein [Pseudomonadota bacterium]
MGMSLFVERCPNIGEVLAHPDADPEIEVGTTADLHKAWQAIHFLLCGEAWSGSGPAAFLLAGGTEVGEDMGYGPVRALSSADTQAAAGVLEDVDAETLVSRWDRRAIASAQLYAIDANAEDEEKASIAHFYAPMRTLVLDAAAAGEGVLIYML